MQNNLKSLKNQQCESIVLTYENCKHNTYNKGTIRLTQKEFENLIKEEQDECSSI